MDLLGCKDMFTIFIKIEWMNTKRLLKKQMRKLNHKNMKSISFKVH